MSQKILDQQTEVAGDATILCRRLVHFLCWQARDWKILTPGDHPEEVKTGSNTGPGRGTYCYIMQIKERSSDSLRNPTGHSLR